MNHTFALTLVALLALTGCRFDKSKRAAMKLVEAHFEKIAAQDYEAALADFEDQGYKAVSPEELKNKFEKTASRLGDYKGHQIVKWEVQPKRDASKAEADMLLVCLTTYSKYLATEQFKLHKGPGDAEFKIVSYDVKSRGLLGWVEQTPPTISPQF